MKEKLRDLQISKCEQTANVPTRPMDADRPIRLGGRVMARPVMSLRTNMIRAFEPSDMNDVLDIWLKASVEAHSFVGREFWESKIDDMRKTYIPASDTYVFIDSEIIKGFFSLHGDTLAAIFVSPDFQGNGIGQRLMGKAKSLRNKLKLTVYKENSRSIDFYRKCGFVIIKEKIDEHTERVELLMEYCS